MKFFALAVVVSAFQLPAISIAATVGNAFWETGSADFAWPATRAETLMRENAQAICGKDAVAKQISKTIYQLVPRAYPTETLASAEFICEQ